MKRKKVTKSRELILERHPRTKDAVKSKNDRPVSPHNLKVDEVFKNMPAKDIYHGCVKNALIKDRWTITHDPLSLKWGKRDMYVDLGAEQLLAAERAEHKIAVEIKSFTGQSERSDLEKAIGQYILYHDVLAQVEPERKLYLAVSQEVSSGLFEEPLGELLLNNNRVRLLVFEPETEEIVKCIV